MRRLLGHLFCAVVLLPFAASASPNDFQLYKLGNPVSGAVGFSPTAEGNFQAFARELGAGISASVLEPPNSLGHSGFAVTAELSVVAFTPNTAFQMPTASTFPGSWLMPSIHVRKGLPFSLEVGGRAAWLDKSGMGAGTVEAKWAITEGFPYFPAVAIRGSLTKLFNTRDFNLETGNIDLSVGKRFAIGGMITLTPYGGFALGWTSATSNIVDFDRTATTVDAQTRPDPFVNTAQYRDVRADPFNRFYLGGRFIGGVIQIGLEVSLSSVGSFAEPVAGGGVSATVSRTLPVVTAFNSTFGLDF